MSSYANGTKAEARIEDSAGHTDGEKLALYRELELISDQVVERLTSRKK